MNAGFNQLPAWAEYALMPLLNVLAAAIFSGLVVLAIGEDPIEAAGIMFYGAVGYQEGLGYTLYYTTNFIFTGLAVAIAYHAGLFNIGGEGQAYIGGLGVGLVCLAFDQNLSFWMVLPISILAAALFGGAWAFIPGFLQAKRGSHVVITTIMFNFIASSLMVYLMVNVLIVPGQMSPVSRDFNEAIWLPFLHDVAAVFGWSVEPSPANLSFLWALICCLIAWGYIWHTRWGYRLRVVGANMRAAIYAGIAPHKVIVLTMCLSGALAGFVGLNEIQGVQHRLLLNFTVGYGFTGIAVALMGRNHPLGIVLAAFLFGSVYQGGAELAFEMPAINRDIVVVIQGAVILFSGALEFLFKPYLQSVFAKLEGKKPTDKKMQERA